MFHTEADEEEKEYTGPIKVGSVVHVVAQDEAGVKSILGKLGIVEQFAVWEDCGGTDADPVCEVTFYNKNGKPYRQEWCWAQDELRLVPMTEEELMLAVVYNQGMDEELQQMKFIDVLRKHHISGVWEITNMLKIKHSQEARRATELLEGLDERQRNALLSRYYAGLKERQGE